MCGICAYITTNDRAIPEAKETFLRILAESSIRGTDATGIGYIQKQTCMIYKKPIASDLFTAQRPTLARMRSLMAPIVIGHTRAQTTGDAKNNDNNHPVTDGKRFLLVHNGIISDADDQFTEKKLPRTGEVDSEVIVRLVSHHVRKGHYSVIHAIQKTAETIHGSMACILLDTKTPDTAYVWASTSPCVIGYDTRTGTIYIASTQVILENATAQTETYRGIFTRTIDNPDMLYTTVDNDTGYAIRNGTFTPFTIKRPAYVYQGTPYTAKHETAIEKPTTDTAYCYQCYKRHTTSKPYMCGQVYYTAITQPSRYATEQLEERLQYLVEREKILTIDEQREVKRLDDALTYRYDKTQTKPTGETAEKTMFN